MNGPGEIPIGIVLPDLVSYQRLVHAAYNAPFVAECEFTYGAPLFKATDAIKQRVREARDALQKFDAYFELGILDEAQRTQLAAAFRQRYLKAHPRSEGSDVFLASGDVLQFTFELSQPNTLDDGGQALWVAQSLPHDKSVMDALSQGQSIDRNHLRGRVKMFLDHVYNPRRRELPDVQEVMTGPRERDPVVVELMTDGALPGLFGHLVAQLVHPIDGALVMLPG
jgi:hypothetical protein